MTADTFEEMLGEYEALLCLSASALSFPTTLTRRFVHAALSVDEIEAGLTGKKEDDALSPLRASNSPSSKAEKAATAWLKKARTGDVPLDDAEVEAHSETFFVDLTDATGGATFDATWDGVSKDPPPLDAAFGLRVEEVIKERVLAQNFDDIVPQTVIEKAYAERRSGKVEDRTTVRSARSRS